ncbi:hypothetical protein ACFR9U_08550 [Halorientalis brevis]|uniref:DUF4013 domain-containing protein n=1 Tax=Halorientalis brevis TaxID=1126241 RepID=A0ABD6CAS2_9EURY|nr:hypothetical protein [Halorientalis brevis]
MNSVARIRIAVRALAKTGRVVVRRPTVLVYPVVLTLSLFLLIPAVAVPIVLTEGGIVRLAVWLSSVAAYFLGGGVLCTVLFGAMVYETNQLFRGQPAVPFSGVTAVWRNRRTLTALGLVLGTGGMLSWYGRTLLERVLGDLPVDVLTALQGSGSMFAIVIVMVENRSLSEIADPVVDAVSETAVESIVTTEVIQGLATISLYAGAGFGIGSTLFGVRIDPLGFFTPFLGFLLVPFLTITLCCLLEGVSRTAIFLHATGQRGEDLRITPDRVLRGRNEPRIE